MDNQGFLAEVKDRDYFIRYLLRLTENVYRKDLRVWVYAEVASGYCSAFQDSNIVAEQDCQRVLHPFICEKDPYISPPGSDVLAIAIGVSAGVFGTALLIIIILAILWKIKSKDRKKQRFDRQASIRSSHRSSMRSRSTMSILTNTTAKKPLDDKYSVSAISSKTRLYDDEVSVSNVSLEESRDHRRTHRSFERLDPLNGRLGSRDRLDHLNTSNGSIGNVREWGHSNGHAGSRDRLVNTKGSFDRLQDSPRASPRTLRTTRETLSRSKEGSLQNIDKQSAKNHRVHDAHDDTDGGFTDDGFSEHEFDDFTTTADESGMRTDDDASGRNQFHPARFPHRVENQIESLRRLPNIAEKPAFGSESSVELSNRDKPLHSFYGKDSPSLPDLPPTPPPPLPVNAYPMKQFGKSPTLSESSSRRPTPQPRARPVPNPRSNVGSKESLNKSGDLSKVVNPLHLSQGNLNYMEKKPDWLTDQVRETSASESDSDPESVSDYKPGFKNKAYVSNEDIPKTVRTPGYTPPRDTSDATNYSSPWRDERQPYINASHSNLSRGSREMNNMDYLQGNYSNLGYEGSHENIPSYDEAVMTPNNDPYQNDPNLYSPGYDTMSQPPPYSPQDSNLPYSPVAENVHFGRSDSRMHPVYRIGSENSIPMSGSDKLPRDMAFMDYRFGSRSTLPNEDGSMPDLSTEDTGSHDDLSNKDIDEMNDNLYKNDTSALHRNIDPFPGSPSSPQYQQNRATNPRGLDYFPARSNERLNRDSPVLYLGNQRSNNRRPEPIETEI